LGQGGRKDVAEGKKKPEPDWVRKSGLFFRRKERNGRRRKTGQKIPGNRGGKTRGFRVEGEMGEKVILLRNRQEEAEVSPWTTSRGGGKKNQLGKSRQRGKKCGKGLLRRFKGKGNGLSPYYSKKYLGELESNTQEGKGMGGGGRMIGGRGILSTESAAKISWEKNRKNRTKVPWIKGGGGEKRTVMNLSANRRRQVLLNRSGVLIQGGASRKKETKRSRSPRCRDLEKSVKKKHPLVYRSWDIQRWRTPRK